MREMFERLTKRSRPNHENSLLLEDCSDLDVVGQSNMSNTVIGTYSYFNRDKIDGKKRESKRIKN